MIPYDGNAIVTHMIRPGETLTSIAKQYRFQPPGNWKPIWNYNTKVHKVLGNNPNLIRAGETVIIPRSVQGYDSLLRKFRELKRDLTIHGHKVQGEMERDFMEHKATRVLFDLTGDIATAIGTLAAKSLNVANKMKQAASAVGGAKPAAQYLAMKEAEKFSKGLTMDLVHQSVSGALSVVDEDAPGLYKDGRNVKKGVDAIRGVSLQGGKSLLDISEIVLSYASVSNVADGIIWLSVGETPEQTYNGIVKNVKKTVSDGERMMDEKITKYQKEKALVYSG